MKKIIFIGIVLVTLVTVYGCKEGLEAEVFGTLNPTIFPSTAAEYELYTMEVYVPFSVKWPYNDGGTTTTGDTKYHFLGLEEGHIQLFDHPSDLMAIFTSWGDGGVFWDSKSRANFAPLVGQGRDRAHFEKVRFVTRTTLIISDLENAPDEIFTDIDKKNQLIAEARMARGWAMLFLLQLYGPVPVILDAELIGNAEAEENLVRPSRDEYVSAIEGDLQFAADNLPENPEQYGRFNKGLALTVLMRLYMHEKNFQDAESAGREVQVLGYDLVDDYASLFREATEKNTETIWAVTTDPLAQGRGAEGNFNAYSYYTRPGNFPGKSGWGDVFVSAWNFYDSFDPADERRELLVGSYTGTDGVVYDRTNLRGAIIDKYPPEGSGAFQAADVVVARYADVELMLAEAINENNNGPTQEAIDLVNDVRERAGIGLYSLSDFSSKDAFNDAILQERAWELYFEGLRMPDLVRHGKWPSAVTIVPGKNPGPTHLFPIPQYALDDSEGKLTQNDGY